MNCIRYIKIITMFNEEAKTIKIILKNLLSDL